MTLFLVFYFFYDWFVFFEHIHIHLNLPIFKVIHLRIWKQKITQVLCKFFFLEFYYFSTLCDSNFYLKYQWLISFGFDKLLPFFVEKLFFANYIQMGVFCHLLSNMKKIIQRIFVDSLSVIEILVGKELMKIYLNIMIQMYSYFCFILLQF